MHSTRSPARVMLCVALLISMLLSGCTSVREFFEDIYREQGAVIFSGQNKVMQIVIYITEIFEERGDFETADVLYDVQEWLDEACRPLQLVSYLDFIGEEASHDLKEEALNSFDLCKEATSKVERELLRIAPEVSASYLKFPVY